MADDKREDPDQTPDTDADVADPESAPEGESEARGGTAVRTRATMPKRRSAPDDDDSDGKALTRKSKSRSKDKDGPERIGPIRFIQQCVAELRKVVWPSGSQWQQYFVVVLIFVVFMITVTSLLDLGYGTLLLRLFG
ncbi:preprotein translocase subunit SecE [Naumannella huperziae]